MQKTFQDPLFDETPTQPVVGGYDPLFDSGTTATTSVGFSDPLFDTGETQFNLDLPKRESRIGRGIDLAEATLGAAIQAGGEIVGYDTAVEAGRQIKERNRIEAEQSAAQAESIGEIVVEALPSAGVALAPAALGFAVGGPVGGLVGLTLGSFGLNLGTAKEIEEALGNTGEAGLGTLGTAVAATGVDVATGGVIGQSLKAPIKEAVKKTVLRRVGEGAALGAVGAGGAQAVLETGATLAADKDIDEDRLDAIAESVALATAFGAGLGGAGGGVVGGINKLRALQDAYDQKVIDSNEGIVEVNPAALENGDGFFRRGVGFVFGKPYDKFRNEELANSAARKLRVKGNQDGKYRSLNIKDENGETINTVSVNQQLFAGDSRPFLRQLSKLSNKELDDITEEIASYKNIDDLSVNARKVVDWLDSQVEVANKDGFKVKRQRNFLPLSQDIKKIRDNKEAFEKEMLGSAKKNLSPEDFAEFEVNLKSYIDDLIVNGGENQNKAVSLNSDVVNTLADNTADPRKAAQALRSLKNQGGLVVDKNNPLELGRFLSSVDQKVLEKWSNKKDNLFDRLNAYNNSVSERRAWAKAYGINGEKLQQDLLDVALEELEAGKSVNVAWLQNYVDVANAQQRQYKRITDPKLRKTMENLRTYQYLRTLPSATLSSIVEPLLIMDRLGGKYALTGAAKALKQVARNKGKAFAEQTNVKGEELQRVADDFNVSSKNAIASTSQKFDADVQNMNGLERKLFKYNLLAYWTEFNRLMGGYAADNALRDVTKKLAEGGLSNRQKAKSIQMLREAGLNESDALEAFNTNTGTWDTNNPAYQRVRAAGVNLIDDVVLRPDGANRPLWQSNPHLMLAAQLKGWSTVFGNSTMVRWADSISEKGAVGNIEAAYKLSLFMGIYTTALMTQTAIKDVANDGEFELDDREFFDLLMMAVGQIGPLGLLTDSVAGGRGGPQRTALALVGGPTLTQATDVASQVAGVVNETVKPEEAVREVLINVSLPNIPGIGAIKDLIRETF